MTNKPELPACPVETTLMLIGDKWKVLILRDLRSGTKRFGELKKSVTGISQKVLTANLRNMEENGLLTREVFPEVPPRVEYTLTELGHSMEPILDANGEQHINAAVQKNNTKRQDFDYAISCRFSFRYITDLFYGQLVCSFFMIIQPDR